MCYIEKRRLQKVLTIKTVNSDLVEFGKENIYHFIFHLFKVQFVNECKENMSNLNTTQYINKMCLNDRSLRFSTNLELFLPHNYSCYYKKPLISFIFWHKREEEWKKKEPKLPQPRKSYLVGIRKACSSYFLCPNVVVFNWTQNLRKK